MSAFMLFATASVLALASALALLLGDALRRERLADEARAHRRARALRLPTVLSRRYVGVERRRTPRAAHAAPERRAA